MLSETKVEEIRRLVAAGALSLRAIARKTGVSRGTVTAIAQGKRRDRPPRLRPDDPTDEPQGPIARCPECGALAHLPCRACRVRAWIRVRRQAKRLLGPEEPLQLELRGEHRRRYEEIHTRRLLEGSCDEPEVYDP